MGTRRQLIINPLRNAHTQTRGKLAAHRLYVPSRLLSPAGLRILAKNQSVLSSCGTTGACQAANMTGSEQIASLTEIAGLTFKKKMFTGSGCLLIPLGTSSIQRFRKRGEKAGVSYLWRWVTMQEPAKQEDNLQLSQEQKVSRREKVLPSSCCPCSRRA